MKVNPFVNFLTGFVSVIVCIIFVVFALSASVIGSISSCITPEKVADTLTSVDYTDLFSDGFETGISSDGDMPDAEIVEEILSSSLTENIITKVGDGITASIKGDAQGAILTAQDIKAIADESMDEIIATVKENADVELPQDDELRAEISKFIDESAEELAKELPSAEEIRAQFTENLDSGSLDLLQFLLNGKLTVTLTGIAVAALVVICVLRLWNFSGFSFAGVSAIITAVLTAALTAGLHMFKLNSAEIVNEEILTYLLPLVDALFAQLLIRVIAISVIAAVLITVSVFLKKHLKRKRQSEIS